MTPAGIKPATFRFEAQHLNQCANAISIFFCIPVNINALNQPYKLALPLTRLTPYTPYPLHALPLTRLTPYKYYPLHALPLTRLTPYTPYPLHALPLTRLTPYTLYPLHALPLTRITSPSIT